MKRLAVFSVRLKIQKRVRKKNPPKKIVVIHEPLLTASAVKRTR